MKGGGGRTRYEKYTEPLSEGGKRYGGNNNVDECDISFKTTLQKIVLAELNKVALEEYLSIEIGFLNTLEAKNSDGNVCGNIATLNYKKLAECIAKGNTYRAKLLSRKGEVQVEKEI